jgi:plasmid maintenance system antidote protein VapI
MHFEFNCQLLRQKNSLRKPRKRYGASIFGDMRLHIGKEIEHRYKESGIKLSEFARRLSTSPRNVYAIFERPDIKTDLLQKISEVLNFNFFTLYNADNQVQLQEPLSFYGKSKADSVSLIVTLDGQETTLNQWVKKLNAINKSIG